MGFPEYQKLSRMIKQLLKQLNRCLNRMRDIGDLSEIRRGCLLYKFKLMWQQRFFGVGRGGGRQLTLNLALVGAIVGSIKKDAAEYEGPVWYGRSGPFKAG